VVGADSYVIVEEGAQLPLSKIWKKGRNFLLARSGRRLIKKRSWIDS